VHQALHERVFGLAKAAQIVKTGSPKPDRNNNPGFSLACRVGDEALASDPRRIDSLSSEVQASADTLRETCASRRDSGARKPDMCDVPRSVIVLMSISFLFVGPAATAAWRGFRGKRTATGFAACFRGAAPPTGARLSACRNCARSGCPAHHRAIAASVLSLRSMATKGFSPVRYPPAPAAAQTSGPRSLTGGASRSAWRSS